MTVLNLTPHQSYHSSIQQHGLRIIPVDSDVLFLFMDVEYRTATNAGFFLFNLRYDAAQVDVIRNRICPATGTRKWPIRIDRTDVRFIYVNVKAGTNEPAEWVTVPWVDLPPKTAFPLPERMRTFLRTHKGSKQDAGEVIEWTECDDVADGGDPPHQVSKLIGENMAGYLEWLSGYLEHRGATPGGASAAEMLALIIDSARRSVRWHERKARATTARALASLEESRHDADDFDDDYLNDYVDEDSMPQGSEDFPWGAEDVPQFH